MLHIIYLAYFHLNGAKTVQGSGERLNSMYTVQVIGMQPTNSRIFSWIEQNSHRLEGNVWKGKL